MTTKQYKLSDKLRVLNRFYFFHNLYKNLLILISSVFFGVVLYSSWVYFSGENKLYMVMGSGVFSLFLFVYQNIKKIKKKRVLLEDFLLYLETHYPKAKESFIEKYKNDLFLDKEQELIVEKTLKTIKKECKTEVLTHKRQAFLSLLLFALILILSQFYFSTEVKPFVFEKNKLDDLVQLQVVKGLKDKDSPQIYNLTVKKTLEIALARENLVRVLLKTPSSKEEPSLDLLDESKDKIFQSFALQRSKVEGGMSSYTLDFSLDRSLVLKIPSLKKDHKFVSFVVDRQEEPLVFLGVDGMLQDPWPSNDPLHLRIHASSKKALSQVLLHFQIEENSYAEIISQVDSKELKKIQVDHTLYLDMYATEDFSTVTIVSEAIDSTHPVGLHGFSNQITLNLVSVYGQYQRSLMMLKEIREELISIKNEVKNNISDKWLGKMEEALDISKKTPYFDAFDRFDLRDIESLLKEFSEERDRDKLYEASEKLNEFLDEHEGIDDRERDRDFFIAARGLSRLLESSKDNHDKLIKDSVDKIQKFLQGRHNRWLERTNKILDKKSIPSWDSIAEQKPFSKNIEKIGKLSTQKNLKKKNQAKELLSQTVTSYGSWLEELESAEDENEKKKQELEEKQLVSIRETIKKMQKTQDEVSVALDKSEQRTKEDLEESWPLTRTRQNSNLSELKGLGNQLKSLNFQAGKRLDQAREAMEGTIKNGEERKFSEAETESDRAGRFLRESFNKSKQLQGKSRNRRRMKTGGDKYYGQAIHNGDIKVRYDYEINRQYREDVLKEIQDSDYKRQDKNLLDSYLRKIIR